MAKKKRTKKAKKPAYERPLPITSPARGRYYAPVVTKDEGYSLPTSVSQVFRAFFGTLHRPGWSAPPVEEEKAGKKKKGKGKGKDKDKKKAPPPAEKGKDNVWAKVDWTKYDKGNLLNTYLVSPMRPPWSNPPFEKKCVPKFQYRNQSKGSCGLGCGATGFTKKQRIKHEAEECPERCIECPAGCGSNEIRPSNVEEHLNSTCPLRPIPCKWQCNRVQAQALIALHEVECDYCPCECRLGCGIEGLIIMTRPGHEANDCPERIIKCPDCHEEMQAKILALHMKNICLHRFVPPCKYGCGLANQRMPVMLQHETAECPLRPVECKFGCNTPGLQGWRLERHFESCPKRQSACPRCGQLVRGTDQAAHDGKHMFGRVPVCDLLRVDCPLGCGKVVFFKDLDDHYTKGMCTHSKINCEACGARMQRREMPDHLAKACPKRIVTCGIGCGETLPEDERQLHEQRFCPQRIVCCRVKQRDGSIGCGIKNLMAQDRRAHEKAEERVLAEEAEKQRLFEESCTRVDSVPCHRGCGVSCQPWQMDRHLEFECAQRVKRLMPPAVSFGVAVKARCVDCIDFGMRGKLPPVTFGVDAEIMARKDAEKMQKMQEKLGRTRPASTTVLTHTESRKNMTAMISPINVQFADSPKLSRPASVSRPQSSAF